MKLSKDHYLAEGSFNPLACKTFGSANTVRSLIEFAKDPERDAWGPRYESANSGVSESVNVKY